MKRFIKTGCAAFLMVFLATGYGFAAPKLVSIAVTPAKPSIAVGLKQQFTATGAYSNKSTKDITTTVTWSSSQPAIATIDSAGLATSVGTGSTTITATSGKLTGSTTLTVNPLSLSRIKIGTLTTDVEGGSARPEVVATTDRVYVVYLGNIAAGSNRAFYVKIFNKNFDQLIRMKTLVETTVDFGGPTDIRIASDGEYLFAFCETNKRISLTESVTYLWAAKYKLDDEFTPVPSTTTLIASSKPMTDFPDGHELLDDPAPLIGLNSVFVVTRFDNSLSTEGKTLYYVREFDKDTLTPISERNLDLSDAADGRGRVASLLFWNNSIYMALATTFPPDQVIREDTDDGALCDIHLVKMNQDWSFDPQTDVHTISNEPNDRENYITGLTADSNYFYLTYKQSVGSPPNGEHRAMIKIFDNNFNLLHQEQVKKTLWGPDGGEIRPSLEVYGNSIYSGQSAGEGIGKGNAELYVYEVR